jgi:glycine/D-amino acid oxidase-like deaminating enzyme
VSIPAYPVKGYSITVPITAAQYAPPSTIIGKTPVENLLLATGHGTLGWTMAAGTGRVIDDIVSGKQPAIDIAGLGRARHG